jgi:membrane protease YdiL (CAAX protease family)
MDLKHLAGERPYLFTLLLMAVLIVTGLFASLFIRLFMLSGEAVQVYRVLIEDFLRGGIAVVLFSRLGWWRPAGYRQLRRTRDLRLFWLALVPAVLNLLIGVRVIAFSDIVIFLFVALLVGFVEESYMRGLVLHALAPSGVWRAAIISAVLFGLLHFLNIAAGWNSAYVFQQVIYAGALGFMYAALAIRTGVIWPLVLTHAATDFAAFLAVGTLAPPQSAPGGFPGISAVDVLAWIIFTGYGVFLLARRRKDIGDTSLTL